MSHFKWKGFFGLFCYLIFITSFLRNIGLLDLILRKEGLHCVTSTNIKLSFIRSHGNAVNIESILHYLWLGILFEKVNSTFQCTIYSKTGDPKCQHKLIYSYTIPNIKVVKIFYSYCTSVPTHKIFNFLQYIYCL